MREIIKKSRQRNDIYPKLKFITVGRLSPEKSILRLVDILHKLDDENYDFSLDIIGDGPEWELIKNRVEHYGLNKKINMLGFRSNHILSLNKLMFFYYSLNMKVSQIQYTNH